MNYKKGHIAQLSGADVSNGKIIVSQPIPEVFVHATQQVTSLFYSRVASLERSVFFDAEEEQAEGDVPGEVDKFLIGGHMIVFMTPNVAQKVEGVKVTNFGQQGNLGRYVSVFNFV